MTTYIVIYLIITLLTNLSICVIVMKVSELMKESVENSVQQIKLRERIQQLERLQGYLND